MTHKKQIADLEHFQHVAELMLMPQLHPRTHINKRSNYTIKLLHYFTLFLEVKTYDT